MKLILLATALVAAPLMAQSDVGTSITTKPATSNSAGKPLESPQPTAQDAMQPNDTSITTRSAAGGIDNTADSAGMATTTMAARSTTDYPWCSRTVTDGCRQRRDPK